MARGEQRKTRRSGTFGSVDKLPSGRYRAQYYGPDGLRHKAPTTFLTIDDARGWLSLRQAEIISKAWKPPAAQPPKKLTFGEYANNWLRNRELEDRTREDYRAWLDAHILPTLGDLPMARFEDREVIDEWYRTLNPDTPTLRARVYGLTSTIFNSAVDDSKKTGLSTNPCRIRGASTVKPAHKVRPATLAELEVLTLAMPSRFQAMVLLAGALGARSSSNVIPRVQGTTPDQLNCDLLAVVPRDSDRAGRGLPANPVRGAVGAPGQGWP
ncbi:tyrosine-type recombinase/integrase [Nocardia brasiliensis]